jgi:L-ascorbate metabolism protein UlaG (beta-lactamase superfamily)
MSTATITWFGHATVRLTLPDERVIVIDPWFLKNPACPEEYKGIPRCDYVCITHGHFDHVGDTVDMIVQHQPKIICNVELSTIIGFQNPEARLHPMNIGGTQEIDGIRFTLTRAYHSSSVAVEQGPIYSGMPNGFVITVAGLPPVYHAGDTDVFSDMKLIADLYDPKVLCLPIGDHFTMGPRGAALAAQMFRPEKILPIHHGTFPLLTGTPAAFRESLPQGLREKVVNAEAGLPFAWHCT